MKRLLILLLLVAIGAGLWYVANREETRPIDITSTGKTREGKPDPLNGTYTFEGGEESYEITFNDGYAKRTGSGPLQTSFETEITIYKDFGDLNNDSKEDAAIIIGESSGLSAIPLYVAAYVSGPIRYNGSNAIFLGDRILPESIDINNGVITVTYLDRAEDEPLAAEPTVRVTKQFIYQNGLLVAR
ncbi:MAG: hypothetical protein WD874_01155 [Parcubacteria group bacterium]